MMIEQVAGQENICRSVSNVASCAVAVVVAVAVPRYLTLYESRLTAVSSASVDKDSCQGVTYLS